MFVPVEALSILEVGGVQAEVQHGADLGRGKGCFFWKVIGQKKALVNGLYSLGGRAVSEEGNDILGILDIVWGVANHGRQDGG